MIAVEAIRKVESDAYFFCLIRQHSSPNGRVGGKALLYFEIVSTLALLLGLIVGNLVHPGSGLNVDVATLDAKAVSAYAGQAQAQNATEFFLDIIPTTAVDAFAKGDILQVLLVALLFGFAISAMGPRCPRHW